MSYTHSIKPPSYSAAFISDLHLHRQDSYKNQQFQAVCKWAAEHVGELYILGDFWDSWLGDDSLEVDDWQSGFGKCKEALKALALIRPVHFMVGNRDFTVGHKFLSACHLTALPDPSVIVLPDGSRALLTHGDAWCLSDTAHIQMLPKIRHPDFVAAFLQRPMAERMAVLNEYQSRAKEEIELDIDLDFAAQKMTVANAQTLIHGHTHRPCQHPANAQHNWARWVLHNWDVQPGILTFANKSFQLQDFNFLSGASQEYFVTVSPREV